MPLKPRSDQPHREAIPVDERLRAAFAKVEGEPLPDSVRRLIDTPEAPERDRDRRS